MVSLTAIDMVFMKAAAEVPETSRPAVRSPEASGSTVAAIVMTEVDGCGRLLQVRFLLPSGFRTISSGAGLEETKLTPAGKVPATFTVLRPTLLALVMVTVKVSFDLGTAM